MKSKTLVFAACVLAAMSYPAARQTSDGFTPLFNGRDFSGWKVPAGDKGHWRIVDGVIDYDAESEAKEKDLWTQASYRDFTLRVDWRIKSTPYVNPNVPIIRFDGTHQKNAEGREIRIPVPDSDSGIFLRGSSKAQVNIWCWPIGSGEVYGYRTDAKMPAAVRAGVTPKKNADRDIGAWNTFEITMRGSRLDVVLNGEPVIVNAELPGVPAEGPIALQHHGAKKDGMWVSPPSLVQFRNISIKELNTSRQNPFVGRWNLTGTGPDTDKVYWLEVTQNGDELGGRFLNRTAHATPLAWIRMEGDELVFQYGRGEGGAADPVRACGPIYRARVDNGKLIGRHVPEPCNLPPRGAAPGTPAPTAPSGPPAQPINWVGVRQPAWPASNANAVHTYGKPVVLVGPGVGLEVWNGRSDKGAWKIVDGIFLNEPPTYNPISKEKFKDFKVEAEFKLDEDQNSGLYLRGRYELQLLLGTGPAATNGRQGLVSIYGWKAADVYAGKPAGEWQALEAIVVGNRVTVTLNGRRVHDNALLPAMTGGALDNDELAPGPIMIQGDHSRVSFRKLVVTPIVKAGT